MMKVLLATLVLIALVMLGIGIGVLVTGKRLKGSCGGLGPSGCVCARAKVHGCPRRAGADDAGS